MESQPSVEVIERIMTWINQIYLTSDNQVFPKGQEQKQKIKGGTYIYLHIKIRKCMKRPLGKGLVIYNNIIIKIINKNDINIINCNITKNKIM